MNDVISAGNHANLPAHIAELFGDPSITNNDLASGVGNGGFPVISFKGKAWHVVEGDNRTLIMNPKDPDSPANSIDVVIVKANANLSKVFYQSGYEEGSEAKPTCYSNDAKVPALDAQERQADSCALCPHNQWGSRITESGGKGKACSDHRRVAVAFPDDLKRPMLLRVPAASLKTLSQYGQMLGGRKVPYQAVLTKVGFDMAVAHPQLTFKPVAMLSPEEMTTVREMMDSDQIGQIIGTIAYVAPAEVPALAAPKAEINKPVNSKPAAKAESKPVAKAEPKKPSTVVTEDELDAVLGTPTAKPAAAAKPAASEEQPASTGRKSVHDHERLLAEANKALDDVLSQLDD